MTGAGASSLRAIKGQDMGGRFISILALVAGLAAPVQAVPDMGAYLAARAAMAETDFGAAAPWLTQALAADPDNTTLLMTITAALIGTGDFDAARPHADRMADLGFDNELTAMVRIVALARDGDWAGLTADLDAGHSVGPMADALGRAWALVGQGDMAAALTAFDGVIATDGMLAFGLYHKALALALVGDFESAAAILSLPPEQGMQATPRSVTALAQILSQLDRNPDAVALIDDALSNGTDPTLSALRARLAAGEPVPFTLIDGPADGLAEAYFGLAANLASEVEDLTVMFFARTALGLRPDHVDAALLLGQVFERMQRFDLAEGAYGLVPPDDPAFLSAELGRAAVLRRAGNRDAAVEVLGALARAYPQNPTVQLQLGDILRITGDQPAAIAAYSTAITAWPPGDSRLWYPHYVRAISHFQQDDWPMAEADFRAALAINPDEPTVLNYFGYSLVERGEKLDEALTLIERAVAAAPQNGAIVDSLAWALFRLGRYAEAVPHMEQAAALLPTDPILNDHLGDVYWAVGRDREARFQWSRALSFADEDPDLAARITLKLDIGLDAVLEREGAPPLQVADQDG
jgi:tetratricopeptide (TPR) repeat protein